MEERRDGKRTCIRDAPPGRFGPRELDDLYSAALTTVAELVERLAEEIEVSEVTGVGRGS